MALLIALGLTAWTALVFAAGGWWPRYRAYRHQVNATRTAITDERHLADAEAWHRRQLFRLPRLHLPRLHLRSH